MSLGLIALLGPQKNNPEVRFHGFHTLFTAAAFLAVHALLDLLGGRFLAMEAIADLAGIVFYLFQAYRAYQGHPLEVPVIAAIARKQAEPCQNPTL